MRIPFPERVPINRVAIFAAALFCIQIAVGTALYFSAGCVVFILIAAFAFNAGGGLTRAAGTYVFCYSVLAVIIGLCCKAALGEPAQSNLVDPRTTIEAYVGSIVAMYAAVVISRRFRRKSGLLQNVLKDSDMYRASVGCIAFGIAGGFAIALLGESAAKVQSAYNQLNQLIPLGIIIGVIYEIRRSGGTRSMNLATALGCIFIFVNGGIFFFSKQAMLAPPVCWLFPVCALRYRLSAWQILSSILAAFLLFHYLVPYSQYGRGAVPETATFGMRADIAVSLLEHPEETRRLYYEAENSVDQSSRGLNAYYDTPQGFWERLQMISVDDKLNDITDRGRVYGLMPLEYALINIVPHVIWPNKPVFNAGFHYAVEITGQAFDPDSPEIGISFSPTGEAYHLARWTGIFVIAPLLWCTFFIAFDSLLGDLRTTPWGFLALILIAHIAPEGGISGVIYLLSFGAEMLVFCAFFAGWVAPLLAAGVLGPDRKARPLPISFRPALTPRTPR